MKLFYLDRVKYKLEERRAILVISCWDNDVDMQRERNEPATGGFGRGRVLERLKIEDSADEPCSMNPPCPSFVATGCCK